MSKIFIQPPDDASFDTFLQYAKEHGYNLEIASFTYSDILDTRWQDILKEYQRKLRGFKGTISIHGAFHDLIIHSRDKSIRAVAQQRVTRNLEIASELNARYIVFHGNFNPLIKHESYQKNWVEQNATFWFAVLDKYRITILLENVWEPDPEIFKSLLNTVNSPRLKVCFDTGHANIFSKVPSEEWIKVLRDDIPYIHVNDNRGDIDNEFVPGQGVIDWQEFSGFLEKHAITPDIVFEVGTLEKTMQAVNYFRERNIYPYDAAV